MSQTIVLSAEAAALLREHVNRQGDIAVDDSNREAYRELANAGLMVAGHSLSGGRESVYRLTKAGYDFSGAMREE